MEDVADFLRFILPLFVAIVVIGGCLVGGVTGFFVVINYNSCQTYESMGIPVQWDFWAGCMADHPQFGWVPVSEYFEILNLNVPE